MPMIQRKTWPQHLQLLISRDDSLFLPFCDLFWIIEPSRSNIGCVLEPSLSRPCSFYTCHRGVLVLTPASEVAGVASSRKRDHVEKNWQARHTDRTRFLSRPPCTSEPSQPSSAECSHVNVSRKNQQSKCVDNLQNHEKYKLLSF